MENRSRPETGYDMDRIIADISTVLANSEIQPRFILVGHSFGVALATEFAYRFPDRVSHLILIAGAGEYAIKTPYRLAFQLPEMILSAAQPLVKNFINASLISLKQMYHQNLRDWRGWDKFPLLKMPTLIILGNKDQVLPQESYQRLAELVPKGSSEVLSVDVSAHMVMLERGDAVNRAIDRFIDASNLEVDKPRWRTRFDVGSRGSLLKERPWLAYYETNVPPTIHVPLHPLTRLLHRSARRFPNQTAIIAPGVNINYRTLLDEVLSFANALIGLGITKGSRVLLLLPNEPHIIIAYYGVLEAGGIVVIGNPEGEESEIIRQINQVETEILVTWKGNPIENAVREQTAVQHMIVTDEADYVPWYKRLWINLSGNSKNKNQDIPSNWAMNWGPLLRQYSPINLNIESSGV